MAASRRTDRAGNRTACLPRAALSDCGGKAFGRPRHRSETRRDQGGRRTLSQSGVASLTLLPSALHGAPRGEPLSLSPARSAFGLRRQALRKGATPLSKPDPTAGLARPRRTAEWASLTLLPSALHGAPRGEPLGPSPARSAFGLRWQALRKGATPLSKPDPTAGLARPRRTAEWASLTLLPSALHGAPRGEPLSLSPARSAFGLRWQGLRKAATPLSIRTRLPGLVDLVAKRRGVADAPTLRTPTALRAGNRTACLPRAAYSSLNRYSRSSRVRLVAKPSSPSTSWMVCDFRCCNSQIFSSTVPGAMSR